MRRRNILLIFIILTVVLVVFAILILRKNNDEIDYSKMCEPTLSVQCIPGQCVSANDGTYPCEEKYKTHSN